MAIKTNIDHIDNVKEIKGFISYQDYVNLDCYQNYVKANGISPDNFAIDSRNSQNLALQDNANKLRDIRELRAEALEDTAA